MKPITLVGTSLLASALTAIPYSPACATTATVPTTLSVRGIISSVDGKILGLREASGAMDRIRLHQGTVINPRGLTLKTGMKVAVTATPGSDGMLRARQIDAPFHMVRSAVGPGVSPFLGYSPQFGAPTIRRVAVPNP